MFQHRAGTESGRSHQLRPLVVLQGSRYDLRATGCSTVHQTHHGNVLGQPSVFDSAAIPAVVFTDPEIAWCGLTETQAREQGRDVSVTRFPWVASGRAVTLDRTEGLTKLLIDPESERVLGVGIVGPGAGDLIAEGALAVEMAAVARDLADTIHAHPTLSETIAESAEAFFGHATHLIRRR